MLEPREKAALLKRYSDRLARYGPTSEALGWTKPKQRLRYRVLLDYWLSSFAPQPLRVLDFGCGFGDLFGYARERAIPLDYTGLDINPDLVRVARDKYPDGRFLCLDLSEEPLDERFDIVLSAGVHNHRMSNNRDFTERSFEVFDRYSVIGFAVDFLSTRANFRHEQSFYSAPEDILALALRYSRRTLLRHDYMPFEFTVFVDKRNEVDVGLTVFLPFIPDCGE
jgi:SAM-dependent methyltransferase